MSRDAMRSFSAAVRWRKSFSLSFKGLFRIARSLMNSTVTENPQQHRFELPLGDGLFAAVYYQVEDGRLALIHTEVPSEFSGQGIASRLAGDVFELLRKTHRKAVLKCPFTAKYFAKHPEYADVVEG
jgi:predicted GNAT family acetyltransferase